MTPRGPRITIGRLMVAVAILAVSFGVLDHVQRVMGSDPEWAWAYFYLEILIVTVLVALVLLLRQISRFFKEDESYARQLQRNEPVDMDAIVRTLVANVAEISTNFRP